MALKKGVDVKPAQGKLGILLPGMGAVATTFIAGVMAIRRGIGKPIGSLTQMGHIRLGKRTEGNSPAIKDYVSLAKLDDVVFGGWDIFPDNAYQAAVRAGVLENKDLEPIKEELEAIKPMTAVFEQAYVKKLNGPNVKKGSSKMHLAEQLMDDIKAFKANNHCERLVAVWCGSTEVYRKPTEVHSSLAKFEAGLTGSHDDIAPSQIYAYACLKMGVPYANGAPNLSLDTPALLELARKQGLPVTGKDFKTGQTLMKTILAPGFKARMLGLDGWYSTNILGNRDGEVLDDPESFKSKEVSKLGVIDSILQPEKYPDLYGNISHVVRINYYPPRGDAKEGWDNIDIRGWLGYPMQIKVNFLCRDSILAAPIVLDLALFMDFAQRASMSGVQEWLSFYWKSPMTPEGLYPEHDLFIQLMKLKNTLRYTKGDDLITHLGAEYYDYNRMQTYRTTGCAKHRHREVTVQFGERQVIPNGERLLISYFEEAVATGVQFKPGQTIAIGGQVLRLKERADGTLGVEEPVPSPHEEWIEQVDRTVAEVMIQRYVCDSVKLALAYPQPRASCLVAECAQEADAFKLTRVGVDNMPDHASGWMLSCTEDHDHGERMGLPLLALSALKPEAVKFLALPVNTVVVVLPDQAAVFHAGKQLTPMAGSYLEMLNARSSR